MTEYRYIDIPETELAEAHHIAYLDYPGPTEDAPVIVCVHGLTRNARDFDFLANVLSKRYRVIAVDMPGRGESDDLTTIESYNYGVYCMDMVMLLAQLRISECHWVGTSMGAIIAMMINVGHPALIQSLVINDIGPFLSKASMQTLFVKLYDYAVNKTYESKSEMEAVLQENYQNFGIKEPEHWQFFYDISIKEMAGTYSFNFDPNILQILADQTEQFKNVEDVDLWPLWQLVKCPVLLLRGEESPLLPKDVADQMQATHQNLTFHEFQGIGHAPSLYDDDQIAMIQKWLGRQTHT